MVKGALFLLKISWTNIETSLSSIVLNEISFANIANWDMGDLLIFANIWAQNAQLSIYWADIHMMFISSKYIDNWLINGLKSIEIGAFVQIWSYSILFISNFDKTLFVSRRLIATSKAPQTILGHLSDTDICPTTEISFSDKRPCRTRIRKRTFVRKSVSIIFKTMLETMVYNVWVTGCSTVRCINVCLLIITWSDVIHAKMGALAFVPVEEVERVWRTLEPLIPADMVSFISYFESTRVGSSTTSPLFLHNMWNQHDTPLI